LPNGYSPSGNTNDINSPASTAIEPNSTIKKEEPNSAGAKQSFNTAALEAAIETKNQISGTAIDQQVKKKFEKKLSFIVYQEIDS
jgi:hypothetical protein